MFNTLHRTDLEEMRPRLISFLILFLVPFGLWSQLSGNYVIDSAGNGDYSTFSAAAADIDTQGVDSAVTFEVKSGTYEEQFTLGTIPGADSSNRVTFRSEAGDPDSVTLRYSSSSGSSNNHVVKLDLTDHVTFEGITFKNSSSIGYSKVFDLNGGNEHVVIRGNRIIGVDDQNIRGEGNLDTIKIVNNVIKQGLYGISINPSVASDILLENNRIEDIEAGIDVENTKNLTVTGNRITGLTDMSNIVNDGINLFNCGGNTSIRKNRIFPGRRSEPVVLLDCSTTIGNQFIVANNFIQGPIGYGDAGIKIEKSKAIDIAYNTVHVTGNSRGVAFKVINSADEKVVNNIFSMQKDEGPVFKLSNTTIDRQFDHNAYYTPSYFFGDLNGTLVENLDSLQFYGSGNANSIEVQPAFADTASNDLHSANNWVEGAGTSIASVTADIDGESRPATDPDIGADEFSPIASATPLSGTYNIDPNGGDFSSFSHAVDSMTQVGVGGQVVFLVASGHYREQLTLTEIPGANGDSSVAFRGATGDPTEVTLAQPDTIDTPQLLNLYGVDHVAFGDMTLENTDPNYGRVVLSQGHAHSNSMVNIHFQGSENPIKDVSLIQSNKSRSDSLLISNCDFKGGEIAVNISGGFQEEDHVREAELIDNRFTDNYQQAVKLEGATGFAIAGNQIRNFTNQGVFLQNCIPPFQVEQNRLSTDGTGPEAIYMNGCEGGGQSRGRIANNFVQVGGTNASEGIALFQSSDIEILHNSIHLTSEDANSAALDFGSGTGQNRLKNNNLVVSGPGMTLITLADSNVVASDHNNFYSTNPYIAKWSGSQVKNLEALQVASGYDSNSIRANPRFVSETDLHSNSPFLDGKAEDLSMITEDIDGDTRDASNPDIGADEFSSNVTPMRGLYLIGSSGSADYKDFSAATEALIARGIDSTVIFDVESGVYLEQITIPQIAGTNDPRDSITFRSKTGNRDDVVLAYDPPVADSNYVVHLEGADRIKWRAMTIQSESSDNLGRVFLLSGGIDRLTLANNRIKNKSRNATTAADDLLRVDGPTRLDSVRIRNNKFLQGNYALRLLNNSNSYGKGLQVTHNVVKNSDKAILVERFFSPTVKANTISSLASKGVTFKNDTGQISFLKNKITGGDLKFLKSAARNGNEALVANNRVHSGTDDPVLELSGVHGIRIYHNTINSTTNAGDALKMEDADRVELRNNILTVGGTVGSSGRGSAISSSNVSFKNSDHNLFFTTGNDLAVWNGTTIGGLSEWQNTTGMDSNSVVAWPGFKNPDSLRTRSPWVDGAGSALSAINTDFEGDARDPNQPDIGADEFSSSLTPLAGTYTVGDTGDYTNLATAAAELNLRGTSAPVDFKVQPGQYTQNVGILQFGQSDPTDPVRFLSETGDPTDVILQDSSAQNTNFLIDRADHIAIRNMTLDARGSDRNNISISGRSGNLRIVGNRFIGEKGAGTGLFDKNHILIRTGGTDTLRIDSNFFKGNEKAVFLSGNQNFTESIQIRENSMSNVVWPIDLATVRAPRIIGNRIDSAVRAISIANNEGGLEVRKNEILNVKSDGIEINNSTTSLLDSARIANNFIYAYGSGHGIHLQDCDYHNIHFNSVHVKNGGDTDHPFFLEGGSDISVVNNNLVVSGSQNGYAYRTTSSFAITRSDHNNIFTGNSSNFAIWNGNDQPDLSAWQNASGMDGNSVSTAPGFVAENDLHIKNDTLAELATPIDGINEDIDDQKRDANTPDIGADEFRCNTPNLSVMADTACSGDTTTIYDKSTDVPGGTTYFWDPNGDGVYEDTTSAVPKSYHWVSDTAGTYNAWLKIEQAAGCLDSTSFTVQVAAPPSLALNVTNTGCLGNDGQVAANPSGGIPPYTYQWNPDSTDSLISGLKPDTYSVRVTDSLGCFVMDSANVKKGDSVVTSASVEDATCQGASDGAVDLEVTGGNPPYSYQWDNGATKEDLDSVTAGIYEVRVIDTVGCGDTLSKKVGEPDTIDIEISVNEATCGDANGSAAASASDGVPPYEYQWSSGDTTAQTKGLEAGIYEVTVTDARGCSNFRSVVVPNAQGPSITVDTIKPVECNGESNGAIEIFVNSGTAPYKYEWSNGATTQNINELSAGPYEIRVIDDNGCEAIKSIQVPEPDALVLEDSSKAATCDSSDGVAAVEVSGGTAPYDYTWSNGGITPVQTGLSGGSYKVSVKDARGCKASTDINVNEKNAPKIVLDSLHRQTCGATDGAIFTSVAGGEPPYDLDWSTGDSGTTDLTNLSSGNYQLTVTDSKGCSSSLTEEVPPAGPTSAPNCMITTVDTQTNSNRIAWEKDTTNQRIAHYNIYKETTQSGVYNLLDRVDADSLSTYTDTLSDPQVRSWRYKISTVDSCGNESPLSRPHKTIHLTASVAVGGTDANLVWEDYEGFLFQTFYVERYTNSSGWENIDSLPTNLTAYTDVGAPLQDSSLAYRIVVRHPTGGCVATRAEDYNSSRSNRGTVSNTPTSDKGPGSGKPTVQVYPNPSDGRLKVHLAGIGKQGPHIRILDMTGRALIDRAYPANRSSALEFDLGNESGGIYHLQVITEKGTINKKVVIR